jgi:hypothetical protein
VATSVCLASFVSSNFLRYNRPVANLRRYDLAALVNTSPRKRGTNASTQPKTNRAGTVDVLAHAIEAAGNPNLMTDELISALADHSAGNFRLMMTLANDVLELGVQKEVRVLDEGLFLELSAKDRPMPARSKAKMRRVAEA